MAFSFLRILTYILGLVGTSMLLPLGVALWKGESAVVPAFLLPMLAGWSVAIAFWLLARGRPRVFDVQHAFGTVGGIWVAICLFGALPLLFSGCFPSFTDAVFESVSGFTTTGASVLSDVEGLPCSVNLWRCETHWLGGLGVIGQGEAHIPHRQHGEDAVVHLHGAHGSTGAAALACRHGGGGRPRPCVLDDGHRRVLDAQRERRRVRPAGGGMDLHRLHAAGFRELHALLPYADGAFRRGRPRFGAAHVHCPRVRCCRLRDGGRVAFLGYGWRDLARRGVPGVVHRLHDGLHDGRLPRLAAGGAGDDLPAVLHRRVLRFHGGRDQGHPLDDPRQAAAQRAAPHPTCSRPLRQRSAWWATSGRRSDSSGRRPTTALSPPR